MFFFSVCEVLYIEATTWMLILVVLEYLLLDEKKYAFNDTVTSINAGILSLLMKLVKFMLAQLIWFYFFN